MGWKEFVAINSKIDDSMLPATLSEKSKSTKTIGTKRKMKIKKTSYLKGPNMLVINILNSTETYRFKP